MEIYQFTEETLSPEEQDDLVEIENDNLLDAIRRILPDFVKKVLDNPNIMKSGDRFVECLVSNVCANAVESDLPLKDIVYLASAGGNPALAVMSLAAVVAVQMQLQQINTKLDRIQSDTRKIVSMLESEYKSKIETVLTGLQRISKYRHEITNDPGLANEEISRLLQYRDTAIQLLGQANEMIADIAKHRQSSFNKYVSAMKNAEAWLGAQRALLDALVSASGMDYLLHRGSKSVAHCEDYLSECVASSKQVRAKLNAWHHEQIGFLEIDPHTWIKRRRNPWDRMIKGDHFRLPDDIVQMIKHQTSELPVPSPHDSWTQSLDSVRLLAQPGKIYYMLPAPNATQ